MHSISVCCPFCSVHDCIGSGLVIILAMGVAVVSLVMSSPDANVVGVGCGAFGYIAFVAPYDWFGSLRIVMVCAGVCSYMLCILRYWIGGSCIA